MTEAGMVNHQEIDREAELDELQRHVERALDRARRGGATAAEASAQSSLGLAVTVRLGEVETLEHMRDRSIGITVYRGRRQGHATCADLEPQSIDACVDRALEIATYTEEDPCSGLADEQLMAREFPDLDIWHPAAWDARSAIDRALACEAAGREAAGITNSEGATFEAGLGLGVYGNSHRFVGRSAGTHFSQSCVLVAGAGDRMQRDYSYDSRRDLGELESPEATGREAARRTLARLGARQLPTGRMPVLMSPELARSFIGHLIGAISGSALYRNASFLKGCAGEQLFPDWMRIAERPHLPRGAGSAAFDAEGVATRDRDLVAGGVLQGYVLSSYSARRLGLETTGNAGGVRNVLVHPGGAGCSDLAAVMHNGFLVTEVMGQGVSLLTGDYSRGAVGFRVEGGQIAYPVEEVTIAGNLRELFAAIEGTGSRVDTRGNIHAGELLIGSMTVAGA